MINVSHGKMKVVGVGLISFISVLAASEIAMAILDSLGEDMPFGPYTISLVILPIFAFLVTSVIVTIFYIRAQKAQILIDALNRVAGGDFAKRIEFTPHDSFAKVYDNFNKMARELGSVKTMRDEFVNNFSHEIKTPLFSIQGFANLILDGGLSKEEERHFLKIISDEAGRLWKLADGTLTLSRLESQETLGEKREFRLDSEINDCIIMLGGEWEKKEIEVESSLEPLKIVSDPETLRQVWLNLLSNAVKFTPEGGKIEVSLKKRGSEAIITFKDTGIGMTEEEKEKIFDKYYRADGVKETEGNGIGLAICRRVLTLAEGKIEVESEKGKGTTFTVTLPVE